MFRTLILLGLAVGAVKFAASRRAKRDGAGRGFVFDPPCTFVLLDEQTALAWARARGDAPDGPGDTLNAIRLDIEGLCSRPSILAKTTDPAQRKAFYDIELAAARAYFERTHVLLGSLQFVEKLRQDFADAGVDVSTWPGLYG